MTTTTAETPNQLHALRELYKNDRTAKAVLDEFASRRKNQSITKVKRLVQAMSAKGLDCSYHEVLGALKSLEKPGYGKLILGRKGHESRMIWQVGTISLGQAAAGVRDDLEPPANGDLGGEEDTESVVSTVAINPSATMQPLTVDLKRFVYPLRPEFDAELLLPRDFTKKDADRLIGFIKMLPFNDAPDSM